MERNGCGGGVAVLRISLRARGGGPCRSKLVDDGKGLEHRVRTSLEPAGIEAAALYQDVVSMAATDTTSTDAYGTHISVTNDAAFHMVSSVIEAMPIVATPCSSPTVRTTDVLLEENQLTAAIRKRQERRKHVLSDRLKKSQHMLDLEGTPDGAADGDAAILRTLSSFDDRLTRAVANGDIRIVRTGWLLAQPESYRLERRQDLEKRESRAEAPFLTYDAAAKLIQQHNRGLGALSYGWLSGSHPDPEGGRLSAVRQGLRKHPHIGGLFWDFASLPQSPRTKLESEVFRRALDIMGYLYASAVGTTVLRLEHVPECPADYRKKLLLVETSEAINEHEVQEALTACLGSGGVQGLEVQPGSTSIVHLSSHPTVDELDKVLRNLSLYNICLYACAAYNERPYAERGWCFFESAVSIELLSRLNKKAKRATERLPAKVLALQDDGATREVTDVAQVAFAEEIQKKTFTGQGDKDVVAKLHRDYSEKIADHVQLTLHISASEATAEINELDAPQIHTDTSVPPLRLAGGVLLLRRGLASDISANGANRLCEVAADCEFALHYGDGAVGHTLPINIDSFEHAALPWMGLPSNKSNGQCTPKRLLSHLVDSLAAVEASVGTAGLGATASDFVSRTLKAVLKSDLAGLSATEREILSALSAAADAAARLHEEEIKIKQRGKEDTSSEHHKSLFTNAWVSFEQSCGRAKKHLCPVPEPPANTRRPSHSTEEDMSRCCESALRELVELIAAASHVIGTLSLRRYADGQELSVRIDGRWVDVKVVSLTASAHVIRVLKALAVEDSHMEIRLHPWNHAPRILPLAAYNELRGWWWNTLVARHSYIFDPLSGRKLEVLQQCVAVDVVANLENELLQDSNTVSNWLVQRHKRLLTGQQVGYTTALLIIADAAAGKSTLMSQVIMKLRDSELIPILVKGQLLQKRLAERKNLFNSSWNWVDAYVSVEYDRAPAVYQMLRQAMLSRRAVILLDGLDEGGAARVEIERHLVRVLLRQGHVILATSRRDGLDTKQFKAFSLASLAPLSDQQQRDALRVRLMQTDVSAEKLWAYIRDQMPLDKQGRRITCNPLMLSMVASIAELRVGLEMPRSVCALYKVATAAMLARDNANANVEELGSILKRVFLEAHQAEQRVIDEKLVYQVACAPPSLQRAAHVLVELVLQGRVPLLSLLQAQPLQVQASHLSFQEYYVALAILDGSPLPCSPWELSAFWANTIRLGAGLGLDFAKQLATAAGVVGIEELNLSEKISGDKSTCVAALSEILRLNEITSLQ
jgi:hypothetical protein